MICLTVDHLSLSFGSKPLLDDVTFSLDEGAHEELPRVQIGILKRGSEEELPELLKFVEGLGLGFLNRKLGSATCICVAYNPIYSPDHLRERGQFTSVIELTFKVLK